jgi:hypothetical protein
MARGYMERIEIARMENYPAETWKTPALPASKALKGKDWCPGAEPHISGNALI